MKVYQIILYTLAGVIALLLIYFLVISVGTFLRIFKDSEKPLIIDRMNDINNGKSFSLSEYVTVVRNSYPPERSPEYIDAITQSYDKIQELSDFSKVAFWAFIVLIITASILSFCIRLYGWKDDSNNIKILRDWTIIIQNVIGVVILILVGVGIVGN